jgi:hypothetical protein
MVFRPKRNWIESSATKPDFPTTTKKTAMLDANGQMHLEYTNLAGQVVATAFAGATPANLTDIERTAPAATILIDLISEDNRREGDALVASRQVIISQPTTATFAYRLTPQQVQPRLPARRIALLRLRV